MYELIEYIRKNARKRHLILAAIILMYLILRFVGLSRQEFNGDEASPLLLIDRMWDAFRLSDMRFLAYPFLFYSDPYRAILSGTLLHFFGPDRVLLRLPNILFGLVATVSLWFIFEKHKVPIWLNTLALLAFTICGIAINDRSAGGDGFMRLNFMLAAYAMWQAYETKNRKIFQHAMLHWSLALLTMLDAIVLIPTIVVTLVHLKVWKHKSALISIIGVIIFFALYFSAWLILPYQAYVSGFQQHYINRGLFYYFTRVDNGISHSLLESPLALVHYSSFGMLAWFLFTAIYQFRVAKYRLLRVIHLSCWFFVILLRYSSFHIIMFMPVLVLHATIFTAEFVRAWPKMTKLVALSLSVVIIANVVQLFSTYRSAFFPKTALAPLNTNCLSESVVRIYLNHDMVPQVDACLRQMIE